ncbi:hypothetical protein [Endozoicomonas sp.]|nr:hypothetical protein [Endozoicomonas sp.]
MSDEVISVNGKKLCLYSGSFLKNGQISSIVSLQNPVTFAAASASRKRV